MQLLREYVRNLLKESKSATLSAQNLSDIGQAIHWLKLNGKIKNAAEQEQKNGRHQVNIKFFGPKSELVKMVKDRFGVFIDVS